MSVTHASVPPTPTIAVVPPSRLRRISTPRLMQAGLALLIVSTLLFWSVGAIVISGAKQRVQTIGHDTAPSVVAAQQIRAHLANLDAGAANAALTRGQAQTQAWKDYAGEQAALSDYLVSAAQNITYGEAERKPILAIATGIQKYADLIGRGRALLETADPGQATAPDGALALIGRAHAMLNSELLSAAAALNDANESALEQTWADCKDALAWEAVGFIAAALPSVALLLLLQFAIAGRTNRIVNPGMFAATVLMAGAAVWAAVDLGSSASALTSAKQDAFDSVRATWKSRAIAYSANADESYFLLIPAEKLRYAGDFQKKIQLLVDKEFLARSSRQRYLDQRVLPYLRRDCIKDRGDVFGGLLGAELLNVTFAGECAAAANAYRTLADYLDIDGKIRDFDATGQRDAAIALNVGVKPGDSNFAFDLFDKVLGKIIDINQSAFESSIATAEQDLAPLPWIIAIVGALTVLLAFGGLRPRLNEYRAG
jgi:hypothetical protein